MRKFVPLFLIAFMSIETRPAKSQDESKTESDLKNKIELLESENKSLRKEIESLKRALDGHNKSSVARLLSRDDRILHYASAIFVLCDRNKNGKLSQQELDRIYWRSIDADLNDDQQVTFRELLHCLSGLNPNEDLKLTRNQMIHSLAMLVMKLNDTNRNGFLERKERSPAGRDYGILLHPNGDEFLLREAKADFDKDGRVSIQELVVLFGGQPIDPASKEAKNWASTPYKLESMIKESNNPLEAAVRLTMLGTINFWEMERGFDENLAQAKMIMYLCDDDGDELLNRAECKDLFRPNGSPLKPPFRADVNRDEKLSFEELVFAFGVSTNQPFTRPFSRNDETINGAVYDFFKADENSDKYLQVEEREKHFVRMDEESDKSVSLEELILARGGKLPWKFEKPLPLYLQFKQIRSAKDYMATQDFDRDGMIDLDEYLGLSLSFPDSIAVKRRKQFDLADRDKDKKLNLNELFILYGVEPIEDIDKKRAQFVQNLLDRHDNNNNGVLDNNEIDPINWIVFDVDGMADDQFDGRISAEELIVKFGGRRPDPKRMASKSRNSNAGTDSRNARIISYAKSILKKYDKNDNLKLEAEERKNNRGLPRNADADKDGVVTLNELIKGFGGKPREAFAIGKQQAATKPKSADRNAKLVSYAKSLLKKYDRNNDNRLDAAEKKRCRALPPNADKNDDGIVTLEELVLAFGGKMPAKSSK